MEVTDFSQHKQPGQLLEALKVAKNGQHWQTFEVSKKDKVFQK